MSYDSISKLVDFCYPKAPGNVKYAKGVLPDKKTMLKLLLFPAPGNLLLYVDSQRKALNLEHESIEESVIYYSSLLSAEGAKYIVHGLFALGIYSVIESLNN